MHFPLLKAPAGLRDSSHFSEKSCYVIHSFIRGRDHESGPLYRILCYAIVDLLYVVKTVPEMLEMLSFFG